MHVRHAVGEERRAAEEQGEPREHERQPVRGHVQEREEGAEEHHRAAEVADEDEHQHRQAPDHEQRPEVLEADPRHPSAHEHVAHVVQVARQEDDDRDLRELGRLELERADADREVRAVGRAADAGQARRQEQQDPHDRDRVPVALERAVVAQEQDRRAEEREPDAEQRRLLPRQAGVDPVDLDQPEAGEQRHQRVQVRVGVRQPRADEEVADQAGAEEHRAVGERRLVDVRAGARDEHGREPGRHEQRHGQEPEQFPRSWPTSGARVLALDVAHEARSTRPGIERGGRARTCAGGGRTRRPPAPPTGTPGCRA